MLNGGSYDRRHKSFNKYSYEHVRRRASSLLTQALQSRRSIITIVGAIAVLLIINTSLQYAAGPALHRALPAHEGHASHSHAATAADLARHIPKGLVTDVVPGGADAELLCVDKHTACDKE
jgi:hypothetical protein